MAAASLKIDDFRLETIFESDDAVVHTNHQTDRIVKRHLEVSPDHETDRSVKRRMVEAVSRWTRVRKIGSGTFGTVWLEENLGGDKRAVKQLFRQFMVSKNIDFKRELRALVELREHKNFFVQFLGWYDAKEYIYFAMEYIEYGDLGRYLKEFRSKAKKEAPEITSQLLKGLAILHEKGYCHRDLKPQNVLVACASQIWVKLADFGVSKCEIGTTLKTRFGTMGYQAPELLGLYKTGKSYTKAVDMWALGCLIHEILTSETPFLSKDVGNDSSDDDAGSHDAYLETDYLRLRNYCDGILKFPTEVLQSSQSCREVVDLVRGLLAANPASRTSAEVALRSFWIVQGGCVLSKCELSFKELRKRLFSLEVEDFRHDMAAVLESRGWGDDLLRLLSSMRLDRETVIEGWEPIFEILLEVTEDIDDRLIGSWTSLQLAARGGYLNIVQRLLEAGAEVNAEAGRRNGRTALQAAAGGGHLDVVKLLLGCGAEVNAEAGYSDRTALQAAAEGGHLDVVELLLDRGAELNAEAGLSAGRTALQAAAEGGQLDVVELLLDHGAEVNAKAGSSNGRTALQAAAGGGHLDVVELLLGCGAEVNAKTGEHDGRTALQAAAEGGHLDVLKLLLDLGAEVNA